MSPTKIHRSVSIRDGYVHVEHAGSDPMNDPDDAIRVCEAINSALIASGLKAVLFDSRACPVPSPAVRAVYWEWTTSTTYHDRVAILALSELTRVSGNMTALSVDAPLRSFGDEADALKWLLRKR